MNAERMELPERELKPTIDELVDSFFTLADTCQLMASPPAWAEGVSLDADRYECAYYRKD